MQKNMKISISFIAFIFVWACAQEYVEKKRKRKEPLRELQQQVVDRSKCLILEASTLIEILGKTIKDAVLVLDEEDEGILGGDNREKLKLYSQNLADLEGAIKKCKNDIESLQEKNSKII